MTSSTVPGPNSRKPGPGKTGANPGAAKFMRMLAVETVPDTGLDIRLCANETECAALADDYGLVAIQTFEADFHVRKQGPKRYKVSGVLHALVMQTCVVPPIGLWASPPAGKCRRPLWLHCKTPRSDYP